jgi:hypothetical protein
MEKPTKDDDDEASISMENVREDPNLNDTFLVRRKAAKRTLPWDLAADELELVSPQQAEDIRATKRSRLEEPPSASTDEAATTISSRGTAVSLPAADDDDDADQADADPVKGTRGTIHWTAEEDAKLNSAVTKYRKKKKDKEYRTDWAAVAAMVPDRTKSQCRGRWRNTLDPSIDRSNGRKGTWSADEDSKLKDAVETHGGKDWALIAALVPGRPKSQCRNRWNDFLHLKINPASGRAGKWGEDEDIKLKDAVQMYSGKNWGAIAALVPGRTKNQCHNRWRHFLDPSIDGANGRTGKWSEDEDIKLKDAVQTHGGKYWGAIAALVPGRSEKQCWNRWHYFLKPNIDKANERTEKQC